MKFPDDPKLGGIINTKENWNHKGRPWMIFRTRVTEVSRKCMYWGAGTKNKDLFYNLGTHQWETEEEKKNWVD